MLTTLSWRFMIKFLEWYSQVLVFFLDLPCDPDQHNSLCRGNAVWGVCRGSECMFLAMGGFSWWGLILVGFQSNPNLVTYAKVTFVPITAILIIENRIPVLVWAAEANYHRLGALNSNTFLTMLEGEKPKPKVKVKVSACLLRAHSLVYRQLSSHRTLTWQRSEKNLSL